MVIFNSYFDITRGYLADWQIGRWDPLSCNKVSLVNGRSPGSEQMEVVPYFWPYFLGIFPYIGLKHRPYIW